MMTERPLIFSSESVRAILAGQKTQTRRVVKPPACSREMVSCAPDKNGFYSFANTECRTCNSVRDTVKVRCPFGKPGDHLWVKETFSIESNRHIDSEENYPPPFNDGRPVLREVENGNSYWRQAHYKATDPPPDLSCELETCRECAKDDYGPHWRSPIFMPRSLSRITILITDVRVEQLQEITDVDLDQEGVYLTGDYSDPLLAKRYAFLRMWDNLNAKRGYPWASNPWCWVLEFSLDAPKGG